MQTKQGAVILLSGLLCGLLLTAGCQTTQVSESGVSSVHLSPISSFVPGPGVNGNTELKAVAQLLDADGVSMRPPCTLRFELYEYVPLSSQPRGKRLAFWPDISLKTQDQNDRYWKSYLDGYEFLLPLDFIPRKNGKYVLEVTCMLEQYRFSDIIIIELIN